MKFIDLFAGVGGFRLGLEKANQAGELVHPRGNPEGQEAPVHGWSTEAEKGDDASTDGGGEVFRCVWSCEIDKWCQAVYRYHWGETPAGDARGVRPEEIPDFDLLCAGFPCQSFSLAGKRGGFEDTRGTLFHEICRIARAKRPKMLLLENVRGLLSSNTYRDFAVILKSLGELGYDVEWQVLNSKDFGVPQNRPRVFVVGHLGGIRGREVFPISGDGETADGEKPSVRTLCGGGHSGGLHSQTTGIIRWQNKREGAIMDDTAPSLRASGGTDIRKKPLIIHNIYGGFGEKEPRVFEKHSPTIRTPKDGGHLPHVVEPMIYRHPRNYGKKSIYSPDEAYLSLRTVSRPPKVLNATNPHDKNEERSHHLGDEIRALKGPSGNQESLILDDTEVGVKPKLKNTAPSLRGNSHGNLAKVLTGDIRIRRLTPRECERLQGFPDDWTRWGINDKGERVEISDTQRYRMMGNAVTVNVVEFIVRRLPKRDYFTELGDHLYGGGRSILG